MNKKHLLKLADLLEADAENPKGVKFDLQRWGYRISLDEDVKPKRLELSCNTAACAIGLACISGAFEKEGFVGKIYTKNNAGGNNIVPTYGVLDGFHAVTAFFDVTWDDATDLFAASYYEPNEREGAIGERAVAKRIRDFVAGKAGPQAQS